MRSTLFSALVALGLLAGSAQVAEAQFFYNRFANPAFAGAYSPYAYSPYGGLVNPYAYPAAGYGAPYYAPSFASPGYVWSGNYHTTPFGTNFSYSRYYPSTNQYFYQYRTVPRFGFGY